MVNPSGQKLDSEGCSGGQHSGESPVIFEMILHRVDGWMILFPVARELMQGSALVPPVF